MKILTACDLWHVEINLWPAELSWQSCDEQETSDILVFSFHMVVWPHLLCAQYPFTFTHSLTQKQPPK